MIFQLWGKFPSRPTMREMYRVSVMSEGNPGQLQSSWFLALMTANIIVTLAIEEVLFVGLRPYSSHAILLVRSAGQVIGDVLHIASPSSELRLRPGDRQNS